MSSMWFLLTMAAAPALAADRTEGSCPSDEDRAVLSGFSARLASSGTAEEARDRALAKIRLGHKAIDKAARILPGEAAGIAEATARLDALEAGVRAADTPAGVAAEFDRLGANAVRCDYTTVEVVVIVIGFVLGIIPGIIFLILFC